MTQLVNKASSWRTLRRKVVVGASSLALVAGMGVALAPSAMAADGDVLEVSITADGTNDFPETIANDGSAAASGEIAIKNTSNATVRAATGNSFMVVTSLKAEGLTNDMIKAANSSVKNGVEGTTELKNLFAELGCDAGSFCTYSAAGSDYVSPLADDFDNTEGLLTPADLDVKIDTVTTVGGLSYSLTSDLTITVTLVEVSGNTVVRTLGSDSVTTKFTSVGAPKVADTDKMPAATMHRAYEFELFSLGYPVPPAQPQGYTFTAGSPLAGLAAASAAGFSVWKKNAANYEWVAPESDGVTYDLGDGFTFSSKTGAISAKASALAEPALNPTTQYVITANSGKQTTPAAAASSGNVVAGPPVTVADLAVSQGDVTSKLFKLPKVLFNDVPLTHKFQKDIYWAASTAPDAITSGYGDGSFRPAANVTRQAFAHFAGTYLNNKVANTVGYGACETTNPSAFTDVPNNSAFCAEVRDLASLGIINGYADGTFKPAKNISRQAIAAMMYRVNQVANGFTNLDAPACAESFNDVSTSNQFCGYIEWMKSSEVSTGYADGGFHPTASSTRQAAVAFFHRIAGL